MATIIPGLYGLDSASAWRALSKDPNKYIDKFAKDKTVQKEVEYFGKKAPTFKNVDELVKDRRALQYLLDSYGLGSEINNAGRVKKILTEDPTNANSLVNKLADPRFKAMASSLRLDQGMDKLQRLSFRDVLQDQYIQNEFEEALGEQDNALRQAAYFARNSNGISNVYSVMGDKILRDVITNTFNLPAQLAIQPIETQAKVIASRIDVTKFASASTSVSATQLTRAKTDHTLIGKNLAYSDAAIKQIQTLQTQLAQLATDYANLDTITDPSGPNAALIAVQQNAVPEMVRFEELLRKADSTLGSVEGGLASLQNLIAEAKKPGSNMTALKADFSALASDLIDMIDNSTTTTFAGSENILMNGSNDVVSVTYGTGGQSVNMNRHDATALKNFINDAASAFNAAVDGNDTANLVTAESRLLRGQEASTDIHDQVTADLSALNNAATTGFFAASMNTTDLMQGKRSVDDALDRNSKIADLLDKISTLAGQSKNMAPAADRSALETQFNAYRSELRDLVTNTGTAGLDNFLNGAANQTYEITGGKDITVPGGFDLATDIADVLDGLSLSDVSSATTLENQALLLTNKTDAVASALNVSKPIMDRALSLDPRGRLDAQVLELKTQIETIIANAAQDGINLLGTDQTDIKLSGLSSGSSLTFRAQPTFKNDFLTGLNNAISQLGNGNSAMLNAVDDLVDIVSRVQRNLQSDNRVATIEYGKLGATIDTLDPKNTSADSNMYKTNAFTQKFLSRYLGLAGSAANTGASSYLSNLFSGQDSASATANLMSLALSIKA